MNYGCHGVARFGDDDDNEIYQNLNAIGKAELMEDFLFIDATARISQQLISLSGSPADTAINRRQPHDDQHLSDQSLHPASALAPSPREARYTQSGVLFDSSGIQQHQFERVQCSALSAAPSFNDSDLGAELFFAGCDRSRSVIMTPAILRTWRHIWAMH